MPRRNRVDPWGDLVADPARGLFTGNRGCVVDDAENVVRHHGTNLLWITCRLTFRDWRVGLARPGRWTPLFFLDDAVALAAGHRPCSTCRREDYVSYRDAVTAGVRGRGSVGGSTPLRAADLNRRLASERLRPGRGLDRAADRILWRAALADLPDGTVVLDDTGRPCLWADGGLRAFAFDGWGPFRTGGIGELGTEVSGRERVVDVLTPPTSVMALAHGFVPTLHPSASHP